MNTNDRRLRHDDGDRSILHPPGNVYPPPSSQLEFNLLVAGCRGGKTSFLRLLLDTSVVSPRTTKDQLASVAKFVQGSSGHTSYIRSASVDINYDHDGAQKTLGLSLIDTPSLDFKDDVAAERILSEIVHHIDARFAEGVEDERKAKSGYRYIHLCIYFLDPDQIVPPPVPGPHVPPIPRTRTTSFSQPDHEPVILEPPVTTNPLLAPRPTLPVADIAAIRRLSGRVNVLPVIARADILSNDRLAAVKLAIRHDLANAGIGFGIFDTDQPIGQHAQDEMGGGGGRPESANGYGAHGPNGGAAAAIMNNSSPPTSPTSPPLLRCPMRSFRRTFRAVVPLGKSGVLDVAHTDFVPLRNAIFHHMETLQRYTQMYLFEKFRLEPILAIDTAPSHPPPRHPIPVQQQQQQQPHRDVYPGDVRAAPAPRPMQDPTPTSSTSRATAPRAKVRTKKITVACNFCRSRKLKCDGGRPTCGQCLKRSNPCDYMPQNKRRGTQRPRKGDESGSESGDERSPDADEPSLSPQIPSQPPSRRSSNVGRQQQQQLQLQHQHHQQQQQQQHQQEAYPPPSSLPSLSAMSERRDDVPASSSSARPKLESSSGHAGSGGGGRGFFPDGELPHIATLPAVDTTAPPPQTPAPMSAPNLPHIRPASDLQAAQRKRAATVPGKSARQSTSSGPKVVACNFCRARKTKCDGAHPACASCARRQLDCNYVHDSGGSNGSGHRKATRRPSTSKAVTADSPGSISPPSSRMVPTPSTGNRDDAHDLREVDVRLNEDLDLKRPLEYQDISRNSKRMRLDHSSPAHAGIP
ncbi:GTP binding protein [Pholiota molesta]|nr:GTP binding protein [Pholiota molesta]